MSNEVDTLRYDDTGFACWRQVFEEVVDEQHFRALALHREAVMRPDAAFWRHERRIGQDDIGVLVPALLAGEGVVFGDVRVGEAVQVEIDQDRRTMSGEMS